MPGRRGGTLRRGGTNPRAGRPHDEFKAALAALADETVRLGYLTKVLHNPKHPQFMKALEYATDRGYGPVKQTHELTGKDGEPLAAPVIYLPDNRRDHRG